jgi:hypothetical protein
MMKDPTGSETHAVAQGEFLFDGAVGRHTMIVAPRQFTDFRVQGPAHGNVDLLKPAADAKDRLPALDAGPDQRQTYGIAVTVEGAMCLGWGFAVFLRMDVGPPAGEQEAIASLKQFGN